MCSVEARSKTISACILAYYKATFRADHVPCSVVLHQTGIRVVGTLNSGKGQNIWAAETNRKEVKSKKSLKRKAKMGRGRERMCAQFMTLNIIFTHKVKSK